MRYENVMNLSDVSRVSMNIKLRCGDPKGTECKS